jgi:fatty acid desaturase
MRSVLAEGQPLEGEKTSAPSNDIPFSLKGELVDPDGRPYRDFRSTLAPKWGRVWTHIAFGYGVLLAILAALVAFADLNVAGIALALLGGIAIGYTVALLSNFFHEAAHYNIAPGRERNDRLANLFFAWMYARSIGSYRKIHFQHHRSLGTTMDSENSYFDALGFGYLAAGIFGLKGIRSFRRYREIERRRARESDEDSDTRRLGWAGATVAVDIGVAAVLWLALGSPVAAVAWLWGVLAVFPFFVTLRQLLEHRSDEASPEIDYREVDHGPVNRLFGDGPVASTLGSAGFNRHALHHWEPTVSYTRLRDLESYLMDTKLEGPLRDRQTTYAETFLRLLEL